MNRGAWLDVVVVIPSFNPCRGMHRVLEAVERELQTGGVSGQIVIVDNASWQADLAHVRARFPGITVIENDMNEGYAAACNRGAAIYQSRYILFLHQDAVLQSGALSQLVTVADQFIRLGCLTGITDTESTHPSVRVQVKRQLGVGHLLVRREAIESVQYFDERFFLHYADEDLCMRMRAAGWDHYAWMGQAVEHLKTNSARWLGSRDPYERCCAALTYYQRHWGRWAYALLRLVYYLQLRLRVLKCRVSRFGFFFRQQGPVQSLTDQALLALLRHGVAPLTRSGVEAGSP